MAIKRQTKRLSLIGISGIIGLSAVSLYQWSSMQILISHTLLVESVYSECLSSLFAIDEGRRGFVLNGSTEFRHRYEAGKRRVNETIARLFVLTTDNPSQQGRLQQLQETFGNLSTAFDQVINTRELHGYDASVALVKKTNGSADITDAIRELVRQGIQEEANLLQKRTENALVWQYLSVVAIAALALISVASILYLLELLDREKLAEQLRHDQFISHQREDFMAALAHNLKIPMIGMKHILTGFLSGTIGELNDDQRSIMQTMDATTDEQLALIDRLLNVYKYQEGGANREQSEVAMAELIRECLQRFEQRASVANVQLSTMDTDITFLCDRGAIAVMLTNFIDNALKFTPSGGAVSVVAKVNYNNLVLEVRDSGCGFDGKHKDAMFENLWKGPVDKKLAPNIGLGLYMCKQIAQTHGGTVSCDSEVGKGSSFFATFPLQNQSPVRTAEQFTDVSGIEK